MKKITLAFSVLASSAMFMIGCKKPTPNVPPTEDKEFQSSIDATYALYTVTDAEMVASFIAENYLNPKFYMPAPGSTGTITSVQDTSALYISFGFNKTLCADGTLRDGTVILDRNKNKDYNPYANDNSKYYRRFGFSGRMTLSEYKVDGWRVVTVNADNTAEGQPCSIVNQLTTDKYTGNISWTIKGNFKLVRNTDSMFIKVDLTKKLMTPAGAAVVNPTVYPANGSAINFTLATVAYYGKVSGLTVGNVPFSMEIKEDQAITRDFTCYPNQVSGVTVAPGTGTNSIQQRKSEYHPFNNGIATFTTSTLYPREIFYGGSDDIGASQCDNSGVVLIKGISYPFDFRTK